MDSLATRSVATTELPAPIPAPERAVFTGSGSEYFRIWIVNLLLTIATLGIYSAWAKVRREQYFHSNTRLAGANFGYHASPKAILRGRLIAVAALVAFQVAGALSVFASLALFTLLFVATPSLIVRALRFRLHNASHRGIRFRFHGTPREAARYYIGLPLLAVVSFGLLFPFVVQRQAQFRVTRAAFGTSRFAFSTPDGAYYRAFIVASLLGAVVFGIAMALAIPFVEPQTDPSQPNLSAIFAAFGGYVLALVIAGPYLQVHLQNLLWNGVSLGPHRFASDQRFGSFFALQLGNTLATLATLGLFRPFAVVRVARYRAEHLTLVPGASLDAVLADAASGVSATGEEVAELFEFDVGF
jgi:uncharacterized membrane protein YjgN (DUF898 family)